MLTQEDIDRAGERHGNGETWAAIALDYGVSRWTLTKHFKNDELSDFVVRPDWMYDAECANEDPEYFEYEPGRDEEASDALARYELAKDVCSACPVSRECLKTADSSDRQWTTRGGLMPLQLRTRLKTG